MTTDNSALLPATDQPSDLSVNLPGGELAAGSYYRSRVITANSGVNRLVSLAQPLLIFLARIYSSKNKPDITQLQENVAHELKTFESRCHTHRFDNETILIARYLLCVAIEESLDKASWNQDESKHSINKIFPDISNNDKFFEILEQLIKTPEKHLDLIELAYLCLSLGFKDSYQHASKGEIQLDELLDHLYQQIRSKRGDQDPKLLLTPKKNKVKNTSKTLSAWQFAFIAGLLLTVFYVGFNYMLKVNINLFPVSLEQNQPGKTLLNNEDL